MKRRLNRHTLAIAAIGVGCFNQLDARAGVIHFWPCAASDSSVPAPNADFVKVSCGADFSIGLKSDGSIVAWGNFGSNCNTPEPNTGYVAIAANNWHAYALKSRVVAGDINGDGAVNVADLLAVINAWGPCPQPCPPSCAADITGDCAVNVSDLLMVINNWG